MTYNSLIFHCSASNQTLEAYAQPVSSEWSTVTIHLQGQVLNGIGNFQLFIVGFLKDGHVLPVGPG